MTNSVSEKDDSSNKLNKYSSLSDDELLILIGNERDTTALTELYVRYKRPLGRFLQRGMNETKLVEEIYNDVMLTIWSSACKFRGESKVSTWIFGIAFRARLAQTKKESRHNHICFEDFLSNSSEQNTTLCESIHAAMIELSEPHQTVIELSYFHGYSTAEIATIVGCPQNTVKTRLYYARQKLKASLELKQYDV